MRKFLLSIFIVLALGWSGVFFPAVLAAPNVTGAAGTFVHKSQITITGSGFGAKNPAVPLKWDDFEGGTTGNDLGNGWYIENRGGPMPKYAADVIRPGSGLSVKQDYMWPGEAAYTNEESAQYGNMFGLVNLSPSRAYYVSFYRYARTSGAPSRNYKPLALRGGAPGQWNDPEFRHDIYPSDGSGHLYGADCSGASVADKWPNAYNFPTETWNRVEYYIDRGEPGVANGGWYYWWDQSLRSSYPNVVMRTADCHVTNLYISGYFARNTIINSVVVNTWVGAYLWHDDVYIDTTQARVELCDAGTWSARSRCEIQIPSAWSATSVTATANRGSFACADAVYLYVVDADGNANANGLPVTLCSGDALAPASPSNLTVQ
jgi:hypothetical protein